MNLMGTFNRCDYPLGNVTGLVCVLSNQEPVTAARSFGLVKERDEIKTESKFELFLKCLGSSSRIRGDSVRACPQRMLIRWGATPFTIQ